MKPKLVIGFLIATAAVVALVMLGKDPKEHVPAEHPRSRVASIAETPEVIARNLELQGLVKGPAVAPILTSNITFLAPQPGVTWAEMAFPCYRAAIELGDGGSVADPFYQASPLIKPALEAAGIRIESDIAAIGGWSCGDRPCFYIAATLREPAKLGAMIATFAPNANEIEPLHWTFEAPGADGPRKIALRVLPVEWNGVLPTDSWSKEMAKATHVIFLSGLFGGVAEDLEAGLATGAEAGTQVASAESVLSDSRGRCVIGSMGASDFKPGFALESSRFALGMPPASSDAIARMMGVSRSLNLEVDFALSAEPSEAQVQGWIEEARGWASGMAAPIRQQFAAQGEVVQVMFDAAEVIATQGFRHKRNGKQLRVSWHTDRISESSLVTIEATLQRLQGN